MKDEMQFKIMLFDARIEHLAKRDTEWPLIRMSSTGVIGKWKYMSGFDSNRIKSKWLK